MIQKNILSLLFSLFVFSSLAQSNSLGTNDADATKLVKSVSTKYATYKNVAIQFEVKIENSNGKLLQTQNGSLKMKGKKYQLNFGGKEMISDGSNLWSYDKDDNETQITIIDKSSNNITPEKLFSDFYSKDFLYRLNDDPQLNKNSKISNKSIQQIELTPRDKTNTYFKILIDVDKVHKNVVAAKIFEKNGNRYLYIIKDFKTNIAMPESLFGYNKAKHPNAEIVDLR